ncbi:MAG TPA: ROK family protein [Aestuariivirga sp.]|jgi:predicted NBD/HSP70 family sugar kinase|nr:ROK family protein [Hyphomicrobiales bacterium]MBP9174053.1 ROK family protein [Hyphomicrobiales bacterium]HQY74710.1 ROK family protein [Aestuariivirga sp.]
MTDYATEKERASLANASDILSLIASGTANSRAALLAASGMSRVTVTQRLNVLLGVGIVEETLRTLPSGGRPTRVLGIRGSAGYMLVADIGETHIHLAAMSLAPDLLAQSTIAFSIAEGPVATLQRMTGEFDRLAAGLGQGFLVAVSLSMPTPVDFKRGRVVGPSVLYGWDDFDIVSWLGRHYKAPIYVENDVNLMTIYEHRHNFPLVDDMIFIKAGTGIGSGIIAGGKIFRGAQGAAGDIGHIQFNSPDAPLCRCGKLGCVEARAGGWAIARDLAEKGLRAETARDVIALVEMQKPEAIMLLRRAGQTIGEVASDVVSILNPSLIVVGGMLARGGDFLLSGIRELVYQRCLPLATGELKIILAEPKTDSALIGAAHLVLDDVFSPAKVEDFLARFISKRPS